MKKTKKSRKITLVKKLRLKLKEVKAQNDGLQKELLLREDPNCISLARMLQYRSKSLLENRKPLAYVLSPEAYANLYAIPWIGDIIRYTSSPRKTGSLVYIFDIPVVMDASIVGWYLQEETK